MAPEVQENEFGGSLDEKVSRLVFYATRHGMMLTNFSTDLRDVQARLRTLEEDRYHRQVLDARQEERDKAMLEKMDNLTKIVGEQKSLIYKAVGVILGAIALAFANFIVRGGLNG